jgi:S1-C subfamily serine protease
LEEAGFEVGDIILGIENQPIESLENFIDLVSSLKPKQKVTLLALDHRSGNTDYGQVMVR